MVQGRRGCMLPMHFDAITVLLSCLYPLLVRCYHPGDTMDNTSTLVGYFSLLTGVPLKFKNIGVINTLVRVVHFATPRSIVLPFKRS